MYSRWLSLPGVRSTSLDTPLPPIRPSMNRCVCVCVHWRRVQHFDVEMAPGRSRVTRRFPVGLSSRLLYFNKIHKFIICTQYFNIVYIYIIYTWVTRNLVTGGKEQGRLKKYSNHIFLLIKGSSIFD